MITVEANETCPKCGSDNVVVLKPKADSTASSKHDRQCHDCKVSWNAATR